MSTIVIIGGGGGGGQPKVEATDSGELIDASGATVAKFASRSDAIAYLQSLEAAGLSAEAPP